MQRVIVRFQYKVTCLQTLTEKCTIVQSNFEIEFINECKDFQKQIYLLFQIVISSYRFSLNSDWEIATRSN